MKKFVAAGACVAGALLLSACGATAGQNTPPPQANNQYGGQPGGGMQRQGGMMQENLQQYAAEADAASDKTSLTRDQFTAELQAMIAQQRAAFPQPQGSRSFSGAMMRGGNGQPRGGSGAMASRLGAAVTFYKYTDPSGKEALIAEDADGNVVLKWPRAFRGGQGGSGSMMRQRYGTGSSDDAAGAPPDGQS